MSGPLDVSLARPRLPRVAVSKRSPPRGTSGGIHDSGRAICEVQEPRTRPSVSWAAACHLFMCAL
jgi:hypothetical protein